MTLPIPSNVFADGELVNEASLFSRVFAPINSVWTRAKQTLQVAALGTGFLATPPDTQSLQVQFGITALTTSASGVATITLPSPFPNGLAWWWGQSVSLTAGVTRPAVTGSSASTIVFVAYTATGSITTSNSAAVTIEWLAIGY